MTAAVMAALWERGIDALWPAKEDSADRVERAIAATGIPEAVEQLAAALAGSEKKWLTFHVEALAKAPQRADPLPAPDPEWLASLPPDRRAEAEEAWLATVDRIRRAAYPDALPRLVAAEAEAFPAHFMEAKCDPAA